MTQQEQRSLYHWESRMEAFVAENPGLLSQMINAFYEGKFVIGTQTHFDWTSRKWVGFVYYKVRI